ncbi:alpha/beta hydrolase-fold protein [Jeongeupia wiesaeckerbachi]|uniref:carbohydrate-binding protein n=1 Tax=Jeongeupia wiesaeckerbachi TaxID=3051218 RepID=UPI003D80303D
MQIRWAIAAISLCASTLIAAAPAWQADQVYNAGDTVTVAGTDYRAQWWTRGQEPQQHTGPLGGGQPWLVLDPAQPPLACGDVWRNQSAYNGNAVVSRHGRNYLANWWSRANDPATAEHRAIWRDLGACNYVGQYTFNLTSQHVRALSFGADTAGTDYPIEVMLPDGFQPDQAYPVLYVLDWFLVADTFKQQFLDLRNAGKLKPFIVVGIGCADPEPACWLRRERDYTPTYWQPEEEYLGNTDPALRITGGGANFLAFLKHELIPRVETRYLTQPAQRGLHGTSLSGLLASHALVHDAALFGHYLINSPALWYHDYLLANEADAAPAEQFLGTPKVFLSMGGLEGSPYLEDTARFATTLSNKRLAVQHTVFPERTHETAAEVATTAGLSNAYGR